MRDEFRQCLSAEDVRIRAQFWRQECNASHHWKTPGDLHELITSDQKYNPRCGLNVKKATISSSMVKAHAMAVQADMIEYSTGSYGSAPVTPLSRFIMEPIIAVAMMPAISVRIEKANQCESWWFADSTPGDEKGVENGACMQDDVGPQKQTFDLRLELRGG